ncbi:hypothetical protein BSKO_13069 [Bryopsis sp. KO-2023]|nr:hypothetical protein BSKO_13069 [Bryopsis sp. KO-2023]
MLRGLLTRSSGLDVLAKEVSRQKAFTEFVAWLSTSSKTTNWVFLGPPGVGKGTYASRAASAFKLAHISTGDLIRAEVKTGSDIGKQMDAIISKGNLLPDDMMMKVLQQRLAQGQASGEAGVILDGFPRTQHQAEKLVEIADLQLVLNMSLREDVLVEKILGRRMCGHCGKNYNIADIYLPAEGSKPEIVMPPLNPPPDCVQHMEKRADDTEEIIMQRLKIYRDQAAPVENFFREKGLLVDFEITSGIPETLPGLLKTLEPFVATNDSPEMATA